MKKFYLQLLITALLLIAFVPTAINGINFRINGWHALLFPIYFFFITFLYFKLKSSKKVTTKLAPATLPNNIKRRPVKIIMASFILIFAIGFSQNSLATTYYSRATGNWSTTTTWSTTSGGGTAGVIPGAGDNIIIERGYTVTVNGSFSCTTLQVGSTTNTNTAKLTFAAGASLTVSGLVTVGGSGNTGRTGNITFVSTSTLTAGSINLGGTAATPAPGTITMTANSTLITGSLAVTTVTGNTWTPSTGTVEMNATNTLPATIFTIFYNFNVISGITTSSAAALTINNTLTVSAGTLIFSATNSNYTLSGDFIVSAGATFTHSVNWDVAGTLIAVAGNVSIDGLYNYTVRSHLQMNGSGKTIRSGNTPGSAFCILTLVNTTGTISASGTVTINDNFWAAFGVAGGSFATNGQTVTANGALLNNGGTVNINGGTLNVSGGFYVGISGLNGNATLSSGTLNADFVTVGTGTIPTGTFAQSGGTANIGNLTIDSGSSYTCSNSPAINITGNWTNNVNAAAFVPASSTVTFNSSSVSQNITGTATAQTFNNIIINNPGQQLNVAGSTSTLNLNGAMALTAGTFVAGTATAINIAGNWTNNGVFTAGSGTVTFNGSTAQVISGSAITPFNNLALNNSTGLSLSGIDADINGSTNALAFLNGKISTGANTLVLVSTATISGAGTGKYINGNLQIGIAIGSTSINFAIGDASNYTPILVNINGVTNPGAITAFTVGSEHPNILSSQIDETQDVNRYWSLANNGVVFTNYNATFNFQPSDIDAGANTANFIVGNFNGSWAYPTLGALNTTNTTATNLTSFGTFAVGTGGASAPTISTQPSNQTGCVPSTVSFTAAAKSIPSSAVQWQVNSGGGFINLVISSPYSVSTSSVSGITTSILTINPTNALLNNNQYQAIFTNSRGNVTSNPAILTLNLLTINSQPVSSQTLCAGSTATFTVSANGTGTLAYQWMKSGIPISDGGNVSGSNTNILTLTNISTTDAATYSVLITGTNPCSLISNGSVLLVNTAPSITTQPSTPSAFCSGSGTKTVSVSATGTGLTYQWYRNGTALTNVAPYSNVTTSTLTITTPGVLENGVTLYVTISGTCIPAITSNSVTLTINTAPSITTQPTAPAAVCAGAGTQIISVVATGTALIYQWQRAGVNISDNATYSGTASSILTITNPAAGIAGNFGVVISGSCTPSATSNTVAVVVNTAPSITTQPLTPSAFCSGSGTKSVSVSASGTALTYQWYRNGIALSNAAPYSNVTTATLTIINPGVSEDGANLYVIVSGTCTPAVTSNTVALTVNSAPSITTQPTAPAAVCAGAGSQTISVAAAGAGLTYQWQRNGINLTNVAPYSNVTTANLTITNPAAGVAGSFDVLISGTCTPSVTSNTVSVVINTAPLITTQPIAPAAVCDGTGTQTISVSASGTGLTYQWYRNGIALTNVAPYSNVTTSTLTITSPSVSIAGNFYVIVSGTCASPATSNSVAVVVNTAPSIITQPATPSAFCSGSGTQTVSVSTSGTGLTYQWYKNGTALTNLAPYSNVTTSTLTITNPGVSENGVNLYVIISGTCSPSVNSNTVQLTVNQIVAISSQPATSQTLCSGSTATFAVSATGSGLTYQWYKGGVALSDGVNVNGSSTNTLSINNINSSDAATYTVGINGISPCSALLSANSVLIVNNAVAITTEPIDTQTICSSLPVSFSVSATGSGLTYQWYKNGTLLVNNTNVSGVTSATLNINQVSINDTGSYYTIISGLSPCTSIISTSSVLNVNQEIFITGQPADQLLCAGSTANFNIVATGTILTYQWRKGTTNLFDGGNISGSSTATLTLSNVSPADAGNYNVVINGSGSVCPQAFSANAGLTVNTISADPVSATASNSSICPGNSSTLTLTGGGGGTGEIIKWYSGSCGGTLIGTGNGLSVSPASTTTYYGRYEDGAPCNYNSACATVTVTLNPPTPATPGAISGTTPQCPALTNQTYSINLVANATTYTWSVPAGWNITVGQGTNSIMVTTGGAGQNGNITVTAGNSCGTSAIQTQAVTINPGTPATPGVITGTTPACPGISYTYSISSVANATTYTWTVPTGWNITSGQGSTTMTVTSGAFGQNGNITVTSGNSCGTSSQQTKAITINPGIPSTPGTISAPGTTVCPGTTGLIYTISSVTNATTYTWSIPTGWSITGGQGTTSLTVTSGSGGQNGNIQVTAGDGCGTSAASSVAVVVNPAAPAAPGVITGSQTVCPGIILNTYSIASITNATTYTWTVPTGWSITSGAGTNSIAVTSGSYGQNGVISVTAGNSCGTSTGITQTINITPIISTNNTGYTTTTTKTDGNISVSSSGQRGYLKFPLVSIPTSATINSSTLSLTNNGSSSSNSTNTVRALGNNDPITTAAATLYTAIGSGSIYNSSTWSATGTISLGLTGTANTDIQNAISSTGYIAIGLVRGSTNTYNFYGYSGGANAPILAVNYSGPRSLAVTVNPPAPSTPGSITGTASTCPGVTGLTYSISSVTYATTYTWSVPTGWTITSGQGTTSITATSGSGGQNGNVSVIANNSCGSSAANNFAVTVNPTPVVSITANYCYSGGGVQLTTNSSPTATSWSWNTTPIQTTQSIVVNVAGYYQVTATTTVGCSATTGISVAQELVTNGNFSAGNTGFISAYTNNQASYTGGTTGLWVEGLYAVGSNANTYHPDFFGTDHTTGTGNFMIVNGSGASTPPVVWQEGPITVLPNTTYYFSAWAMSVNAVSPFAYLQFNVNGALVGTVDSLKAGPTSTSSPDNWTQFYGTWNSGTSTSATVSIVDLSAVLGGNDFGLDDISFGTLSPFIRLTSAVGTDSQTTCINTPITNITYSVGSGATGPSISGLPTGLTSFYNGVTLTISGTPTVSGFYKYYVSTTGTCAIITDSGIITINTQTINLTSGSTIQTLCINTPITDILYAIGGTATGASVSGLPSGITGTYNSGLFIITGSPTVAGIFNYTITTSGTCSPVTVTGTITVNSQTISLSSGSASPTPCINTAISSIVYTIGGTASGAGVTGLPTGITGNYSAGIFTISGIPTVTGTFNYVVTTTGTCTSVSATGTITVNPDAAITLSSAIGTDGQSLCINNAITIITYLIGGSGTNASITGLPSGLNGVYNSGVFTISGTPTVAGIFNYMVTASGTCASVTTTGTITVNSQTISLTSGNTNQSLCINNAISNIVYTIGGTATSASVAGLPTGVNGNFSLGIFTISGTPTVSGIFNYTITTTGTCTPVSTTGKLTVNPDATIMLSSATGTDVQSLCINNSITNIIYSIGGTGTSAAVTGLPSGLTGVYSAGIVTISGSPNAAGIFNYTVTVSGTCAQAIATGSISINPTPVLTGASQAFSLCSGGNASINLTGLVTNSINNTINYSINGVAQTPVTGINADASGNASFITSVLTTANNGQTLQITGINNGTCTQPFSQNAILTVNSPGTWLGINTNWFDPLNWCSGIPTSTTDVLLPGGLIYYPDVTSGTAITNSITIQSGASVIVNGASIQIYGTITNTGSFDATQGTIELDGSNAQTIAGSMFVNKTINDLTITNTSLAGASVAATALDTLMISGTLAFGDVDNAIFNTNNNLTLLSSDASTARVADITNAGANGGNTINGKVIVERYIAAHRAWRLLTAPISSPQSINSSWQEGYATTTPNNLQPVNTVNVGYGTEITNTISTVPGLAGTGYDAAVTNNPSIKYLNGSGWAVPINTQTTSVNSQQGFMLFVRGDRTVVVTTPPFRPSTPTILRVQGTLNQNDKVIPIATTGFQILGNPYASEINLNNMFGSYEGITSSNYYLWDPLMTGTEGVGAFFAVSYNGSSDDYTSSSHQSPFVDGRIESGEAFLFNFQNSGTVTFHETDKDVNSPLVFRPANNSLAQIFRINLNSVNSDGSSSLDDGALVILGNQFSNTINWMQDAQKITNPSENLAIVRNGQILAIDKRQPLTSNDTIYLSLAQMQQQTYQFQFFAEGLSQSGLNAMLIDSFLHTSTPVSLSDTVKVNFAVTSNAASQGAKRFKIIFNSIGTIVPVTYTSIKAWQINNSNSIAVQWQVQNELNIKQYVVQKSIDGQNFTDAAIIPVSTGNLSEALYNWVDQDPSVGDNFYRIENIDLDGSIQFSSIVKVTIGSGKSGIAVYPNPIANEVIGVQFINMPKGKYNIHLFNSIGQLIISKEIDHLGGSSTEPINMGRDFAKGSYQLEVVKPDNSKTVISILN